jgi:hypothetical protein
MMRRLVHEGSNPRFKPVEPVDTEKAMEYQETTKRRVSNWKKNGATKLAKTPSVRVPRAKVKRVITMTDEQGREYIVRMKRVSGGRMPKSESFEKVGRIRGMKRRQVHNKKNLLPYEKIDDDFKEARETIHDREKKATKMPDGPNVSDNIYVPGISDNRLAGMLLGSKRPNPVKLRRVQIANTGMNYMTQSMNKSGTVMNNVDSRLKRLNGII